MPDYLPRRDAELLSWSAAFDANVHAAPQDFGLSAEQAANYRTLHLAFADALQTTDNPGTRTASSIAAKEDRRAALIAMARVLANVVRANPDVNNSQRIQLGLRPRAEGRRSRVPAPAAAPWVSVVSRDGWTVRVALRDHASPTRVAKPAGVASAYVFTAIGQTAPADRAAWSLGAQTTRTVADVTLPAALPPGTKVWITAQWASPTNQLGPASDACVTWVAGGARRVA